MVGLFGKGGEENIQSSSLGENDQKVRDDE